MVETKIYIILPIYNWEKYILDQLISIYEQSFTNRNLFIINDWSKDNSLNIIKNFIENYNLQDKIFVFSKKNWWVNSAMSFWFSKAKKHIKKYDNIYISYCDADDIRMKNKLEEEVKYLKKNNCDLCYHDLIEIDEFNNIRNLSHENRIHSPLNNIYDQSFWEFCTWNHITSTSLMFKAELIKYIYPFPNILCQDIWTVIVVSFLNKKIEYINKKLWYYRIHSSSLSSNKKNRVTIVKWYKDMLLELKKRFNKNWLNPLINLYQKREKWELLWYSSIHIILLIFMHNMNFWWFIFKKPFKFIYYKIVNIIR